MKNANVHIIVSEVHRLLSQYTSGDFAAAGRYPGVSGSIRAALQALARAREDGQSGDQSPNDADLTVAPRQNLEGKRPPPAGQRFTKDGIVDTILRSPRFSNTRAILEFAREQGLHVEARPKDGKARLARRLAAAIEAAPEPKRLELLGALNRERGSQTQGWLGVIKGTGHD